MLHGAWYWFTSTFLPKTLQLQEMSPCMYVLIYPCNPASLQVTRHTCHATARLLKGHRAGALATALEDTLARGGPACVDAVPRRSLPGRGLVRRGRDGAVLVTSATVSTVVADHLHNHPNMTKTVAGGD